MNPPVIVSFICFALGLLFLVGRQFEPAPPKAGQTWLYTSPNPFASPRVETRVVLRVSDDWVEYSVEGRAGCSYSWTVDGFRGNSKLLNTP